MRDSIFKEYDIRGKVGKELILDQAYDLGRAIAAYFKEQAPQASRVVVGMDTRATSPVIKEDICKALQDSGFDVIFIGVCPSPVLYFGTFTMPVDAGLMITASHNPPEYNGIKLVLQKSFIWGKQIKYIGKLYREKKRVESTKKGSYTEQLLIPTYVSWMVEHMPQLKDLNIPFAVDTGSATGALVIPALAKAFGWKQMTLLCGDISAQPRHEADPVVEKNMICIKEALATGKFEVGIGLDGDSDRMGAMTKQGYLVPGDRLLTLFAQQIAQEHPGTAVVFDIKSSSGLIEVLEKWGLKPVMSPSGHALIKEHMHTEDALLGGELSCHFFFQDRYFGFDDGIYAMLRLLEVLVQTGKTLDELIRIFPHRVSSDEYRISCPDDQKQAIIDQVRTYFEQLSDVQIITIDGVRAQLPYGWGIVRASNTQPVLSIRFESDSEQGLQRVKREFIKAFGSSYDVATLQAEFGL